MTETICPTCGYPTQDGAYTCEECLTGFGNFIGSVPALEEQLLITMTGERSPIPGYSAPSSEAPMPYDVRAGDLLAELRNELVGWVRQCHEEGVRHSSPHAAYPEDTLGSMVDWLLWRVDGMAWVKWSPDAVRAAAKIEERVMRAIDPIITRVYLGNCDQVIEDEPCGFAIYHTPNHPDETKRPFGICSRADCGTKYLPEARQTKLRRDLDDKLMTAAEIASASTHLGLKKDREQVRKLVNQWHKRKQIIAKSVGDSPRFRYGDVAPLLAKLDAS